MVSLFRIGSFHCDYADLGGTSYWRATCSPQSFLAFSYSMVGWRGMFLIGDLPIVLLPYIWFKVLESPVWLAATSRKENTVLLPVLRKQRKLCLYLVLVMALIFQSRDAGSLSYLLKIQNSFDPHLISIIAIFYNIAAMLGRVERIGRKKVIIIASFLALPIFPIWVFSSGSYTISLGVFLMQFMVQGA